jgi:hypothetical protein
MPVCVSQLMFTGMRKVTLQQKAAPWQRNTTMKDLS